VGYAGTVFGLECGFIFESANFMKFCPKSPSFTVLKIITKIQTGILEYDFF
jgi:hypothetical protein